MPTGGRGRSGESSVVSPASPGYPPSVAVSERDREHFRRLGALKAASHAEAQAAHLALPMVERLRRSWALYLVHRAAFAGRQDDPSPFYDRARELGLYTP
jgi:hypothetical protein